MTHLSHAIILIIGIVAISSCNNSKLDNEREIPSNERQWVEIEASLVEYDRTRTVRKIDGRIYWNPYDEINVFYGTDKGHFTSTNEEDVLTAKFSGTLLITSVVGMNEGGDDDNCLWGLYPYDENASLSNGEISTTLSENQTGVAGSFNDDTFITLAKNNSFSLAFYNVLSGFRFTVSRAGITSVSFSGNNNEELAGQLKLSFGENARPVVKSISNGKTELILTPENGEFVVGEDYYFVMVPTQFNNGFTVTMTTANGERGVFTYSKSVNFARNVFIRKTNVDNGVQFRPDLDSGPGKNEDIGYDIVNL